jgi:hypothetical protein
MPGIISSFAFGFVTDKPSVIDTANASIANPTAIKTISKNPIIISPHFETARIKKDFKHSLAQKENRVKSLVLRNELKTMQSYPPVYGFEKQLLTLSFQVTMIPAVSSSAESSGCQRKAEKERRSAARAEGKARRINKTGQAQSV